MSVSRKIHFNALPESVRRRFVDRVAGKEPAGPLHAAPLSSGYASLGSLALVGLAVVAAACNYGFGDPWSDGGLQGASWLLAYVAGVALAAWSIQRLVRRIALRRGLPYPPGRYLFGLDFVDARSEVLEIWPMARCADFQGTHHHTNGVYTHTSFTFHFEGGHKETFSIRGKEVAENLLDQLGGIQGEVSKAAGRLNGGEAEEEDLAIIFTFDPFFEARLGGQWDTLSEAPPRPGASGDALAKPASGTVGRALALAAAAAIVLGPATWYVRNALSDASMWAFVEASGASQPVQAYLRQGGAHRAEAEGLLRERKYHEAAAEGTVTALRRFLSEYPDHADAKLAVHSLYEQAVAAFADQANQDDAELVPFVEALVGHLEATASTRVDVRFNRPTQALLEVIDERVAEEGGAIEGIQVAPVAPHFSAATAELRERAILDSLQKGFGAVFPQDIMELSYVAQSGDAGEGDITRPTIDVSYMVAPSGNLYSGERRDRAFIGIQVHFTVEMRVPEHPETISFDLTVEPPDQFAVESSYMAFAGVPAQEPSLSDDLVYRVMAARAFDHLSQNLRNALFRRDSEAFRQAEQALEPPADPSGAP